LRRSGKIDKEPHSQRLLHEPVKDKVLAWKSGDPIPRSRRHLLRKASHRSLVTSPAQTRTWKDARTFRLVVVSRIRELDEVMKERFRVIEAAQETRHTDLNPITVSPIHSATRVPSTRPSHHDGRLL